METGHHFSHKHILSLEDLSSTDISFILQTADSFKEISTRSIKKVPTLRGKTVINLFFEPSTRTRLSFEIAAKRMSADTFNIASSTSSATKGETLVDTALNLAAMNPDIIIIRHEDVSIDPANQFKQLYKQLGLELSSQSMQVIESSSSKRNPQEISTRNVHSVAIDSQANIKNWQKRLTDDEIDLVYQQTRDVASLYYSEADWQ